jgi:hypothetical protein
MKTKLISQIAVVVLFVLITENARSQCFNTINTPTTDWEAPNTVNTWNWTQEFFDDMYISSDGIPGAAPLVISPFYPPNDLSDNPNVEHFHFDYAEHGYNGLDFHPQDGWELLVKNFGSAEIPETYPLFALYNRFTGLIRVFVYIPVAPVGDLQNGALIKLHFNNSQNERRSALLAHLIPIYNDINDFDYASEMSTPNYYVNQDNFWLYAEFPAAYDPCTCTYPSKLNIEVNWIESSDVTLEGDLTGTISQVMETTQNVTTADEGFMAISDFTIADFQNLYKAGQKAYTSWDKYADQALDFANDNQSWLGPSLGLDLSNLSQWTAVVPYVGTAIGILDFFLEGGKKTEEVKKPEPMVFETSQKFVATGQIVTQSAILDKTFITPSSDINAVSLQPIYNNTLGVVAVMEKPTLQFVEYSDINQVSTHKIRQYKPAGSFSYKVNPASGMRVRKIDVACQVRYVNVSTQNPNPSSLAHELGLSGFAKPVEFGPPANYGGASLQDRYKNNGFFFDELPETFPNDDGGSIIYRTPFVPIQCFNDLTFMLYKSSTTNALQPQFYYKLMIELEREDDLDAQTVLLVLTMKSGSGTVANITPTNHTLSYSVDQGVYGMYNYYYPVQTLVDNNPGVWLTGNVNTTMLDNESFLNATVSSDPYTNNVIGNIQILDNTTVQSNVTLTAGSAIELFGSNTIQSNITMKAGAFIEVRGHNLINSDNVLLIPEPSLACGSGSVNDFKTTDAFILSYCESGSTYDNHSSDPPERLAAPQYNHDVTNEDNLTLFPSPAQNNVYIKLIGEEGASLKELSVSDVTGRVIDRKSYDNSDVVLYDASLLDTGTYMVSLTTGGKTYHKKLLIQK